MTRLEAQYPWMDDRSAWQETVGQEIPLIDTAGAGHGYWVTGNGRIFAARHNLPFTRLESILGPDYSREDDFTGWGAQEFIVRQHGAAIDWMTQTAFRIRRTAILGAECRADGLRLVLQDAVPPSWPIILRSIAIENTGLQSLTGLEIEVQLKELPANCHLVQLPNGIEVDAGGRKLRAITLFGNPIPDTSSFRIPLPTILTGDDFLLQIVLITGTNDEELSALAAKAARNPDDVPRAAYHWWQTWMSSTLTVASDDPRIDDLLDETTILTACQQAENGVIAPLTERSTSTAVDDLPVVRWLLSIGKSVEAARVLHARYSATCAQQSYATQIMAAQDGTLGEIEPEWRSLTHPPSWTAMSIINAHWEYWDSTHDHELLTRHYHYLRWLANLDFEEEPLIPFGGDEPFYTAFQQELPAALSSGLLPDPSQYSDMRPYPWGAAPAMARVSALEHFAAIAEIQGDDAAAAASLELAERLREHTESTYWLASAGYYAAALSRVDHELYLAPHLPTALAPLLMAYGTTSNEHVRTGVNTALQYLLEPNGLPRLTPAMPGFPGELLGQLLACLSSLADVRMTAIYHAILASASPAGEFRSRYIPPEYGSPCCGGADPMVSTWIAQGLLAYLCTMQRTNERFIVAPNLPPEIDRIHLENMNVALFVFEVIQQREGDHVDIRIGNISGPSLHVSLRNPGTGEIGSMSILPGETNHTTLIPAQSIENLPERQTFVAPSSDRLAGRMLILTVDADSFADWQQEHDAVVLDASMVISVEQFTQVLLDNNQRRYETLYFDVPTMGAAWTGLSQDFWDDPKLQSTLTTFRELGGQITSTRYVEEWDIYIPGQPPVLQLFPNGWVSMPPVNGTVTATSHLICENGNAVETLLYATNDTEIDVWVNGERIWRRGKEAEGQRVRIETDLLAGENIVTVNCNGHMDHAMGFCLGLRGSPDK